MTQSSVSFLHNLRKRAGKPRFITFTAKLRVGAVVRVAGRAQISYGRRMAKNSSSAGSGPKQRQLRVGEVIRRRLSEVLMRGDVHDPELNRFSITVSEVRTSTDLKVATAYIMPLGGREADVALLALRRNKAELRHQVAKELTLKFAPDLRFELDATFDRMDEARRLFADERVRADVAAVDTPDDQGETGARDDDARG